MLRIECCARLRCDLIRSDMVWNVTVRGVTIRHAMICYVAMQHDGTARHHRRTVRSYVRHHGEPAAFNISKHINYSHQATQPRSGCIHPPLHIGAQAVANIATAFVARGLSTLDSTLYAFVFCRCRRGIRCGCGVGVSAGVGAGVSAGVVAGGGVGLGTCAGADAGAGAGAGAGPGACACACACCAGACARARVCICCVCASGASAQHTLFTALPHRCNGTGSLSQRKGKCS